MQSVDESLWKVAAQLVFGDVELLRVQAGRSPRGLRALVPSGRLNGSVLLVQGQRDQETAEREGALDVAQRPRIMAESIGVAVHGQLVQVVGEGGDGARIIGGNA